MVIELGSGLDIVAYQDAITARVRELFPDWEVIEDTLEDDRVLKRDMDGKMEGFYVLRYGPIMPKRRGKSMKGNLHDEYYGTVDVMGVAPKGRIARQMAATAATHLLPFKPDGVAAMSLQDDGGMFAAFVVSSNEARPTRSIASQRLRFNVNNRNIGQLLGP